MVKHYYVSDDLDELEQVEQELEFIGIKESQIHVLSESAVDVENHHLHMVNSTSEMLFTREKLEQFLAPSVRYLLYPSLA